jgi:arylformamidase
MQDIIDLSHIIEQDMPVYPGTKPPTIVEACSIEKDGFKESLFTFYSHIGTHLDVPAHIFSYGKSIEQFDCNKFFGPAIVINCGSNPIIDLPTVKQAYSNSNKPAFILFHTGWSDFWGMEKYFKSFPVLSTEAANYIKTLPVKGLGIDAISFDAIGEDNLTNHKIFLQNEIILVENLCCLDKLPKEGFYFSCLPLKIKGSDGAPTRAFAIIT